MKRFIRLAAALVAAVGAWAAEPPKQPPSADVVLEWLRYGNERHAQGNTSTGTSPWTADAKWRARSAHTRSS